MKSAFELAMERLGGGARQYTAEQKERFNEIDRDIDAQIAQVKLQALSDRLKLADDMEKLKEFDDHLAEDLRRLEVKREDKKEALRREFSK
ncbi:MAG: hypothetical protein IKP58_06240 [Victivallales bacterium]|nr:hypothetical protein [Victivallales bacterium]